MAQGNHLMSRPINSVSLTKRMLLGGGIAFLLIGFFLFQVKNPNPEWGSLWMVRPMIIVPLAGSVGGLVFYFLDYVSYQGGWRKPVAYVASFIIYIFGLWIGTVLGLVGTLWD